MALLKFELTEKHIALGKHVNLKDYFESRLNPNQKAVKALIYDEFGLILYGRPEGEFDPMSDEDIAWSAEQKEEMDKLYDELPVVIQIMLQTGTFEAGLYKTKHYDINWKKSKK